MYCIQCVKELPDDDNFSISCSYSFNNNREELT